MKKEIKKTENVKELTDEQVEQIVGGAEHDSVKVIIKDRPKFTPPVMRFGFSIDKEKDS